MKRRCPKNDKDHQQISSCTHSRSYQCRGNISGLCELMLNPIHTRLAIQFTNSSASEYSARLSYQINVRKRRFSVINIWIILFKLEVVIFLLVIMSIHIFSTSFHVKHALREAKNMPLWFTLLLLFIYNKNMFLLFIFTTFLSHI